MEEALEEQFNPTVPGKYIARLLEIILQHALFEFNNDFYQQKVGTSMVTKPALMQIFLWQEKWIKGSLR